jgi:2-hydroxychromene-2-carboxylate isomerase
VESQATTRRRAATRTIALRTPKYLTVNRTREILEQAQDRGLVSEVSRHWWEITEAEEVFSNCEGRPVEARGENATIKRMPGRFRPVFYYDLNSPFAYLAAERVNRVLPMTPDWQPISFGHVLRATGREPWSFRAETRSEGISEIERRAAERGLPPLAWPPGWPIESYSLLPLRAATFAKQTGREIAFSLAAFRAKFAEGKALRDPEEVLATGEAAGIERHALEENLDAERTKEALKKATNEALERGLVGVPSVWTGSSMLWGDDQLENAATCLEANERHRLSGSSTHSPLYHATGAP